MKNDNESQLYYKGNTEIKKKGVALAYTAEQIKEIIKCNEDIVHFLSNYVYIISLDKGKTLFRPYDYQCEMLKIFNKNRFSIAKLSRQSGKCVAPETMIRVRNKKTGLESTTTIKDFYDLLTKSISH